MSALFCWIGGFALGAGFMIVALDRKQGDSELGTRVATLGALLFIAAGVWR